MENRGGTIENIYGGKLSPDLPDSAVPINSEHQEEFRRIIRSELIGFAFVVLIDENFFTLETCDYINWNSFIDFRR
jgi:hypothetical protein